MLEIERPRVAKEYVSTVFKGQDVQNNPKLDGGSIQNDASANKLPKVVLNKKTKSAAAGEGPADQSSKSNIPSSKYLSLVQESMQVNQGNKQKFKDKMCKVVQDKQGEDAIIGYPGK